MHQPCHSITGSAGPSRLKRTYCIFALRYYFGDEHHGYLSYNIVEFVRCPEGNITYAPDWNKHGAYFTAVFDTELYYWPNCGFPGYAALTLLLDIDERICRFHGHSVERMGHISGRVGNCGSSIYYQCVTNNDFHS